CPKPEVRAHRAAKKAVPVGFKTGTRMIELLVPFDLEARMRGRRKDVRTSEAGHQPAHAVPRVAKVCSRRDNSPRSCFESRRAWPPGRVRSGSFHRPAACRW